MGRGVPERVGDLSHLSRNRLEVEIAKLLPVCQNESPAPGSCPLGQEGLSEDGLFISKAVQTQTTQSGSPRHPGRSGQAECCAFKGVGVLLCDGVRTGARAFSQGHWLHSHTHVCTHTRMTGHTHVRGRFRH